MKLTGENRSQLQMFCLEESVAEDSYLRVVDAFVDYLNPTFEVGGFKIEYFPNPAHRP